MKSYTYRPDQLGFGTEFPSGTLRLDGFEKTEDPNEADIFIIPPSLMHIQTESRFKQAPYYQGNEERHVAFDVSDHEYAFNSRSILIRCNFRPFMKTKDPNSISWAWPVDDYSPIIPLPEGGFKHDVGFHAWYKSHQTRELCMNSCLEHPQLKKDISGYKDFTGYIWDTPEGIRRRIEFRRSMKECRVSLCPESINGVFPYRFFEAMSAGRVGALFGNDFIFPFSDQIPWSEICVMFPREEAPNAGRRIHEFLQKKTDQDLIDMGQKARHYWEKYLNRELWPSTMSLAVQMKLQELGIKSKGG